MLPLKPPLSCSQQLYEALLSMRLHITPSHFPVRWPQCSDSPYIGASERMGREAQLVHQLKDAFGEYGGNNFMHSWVVLLRVFGSMTEKKRDAWESWRTSGSHAGREAEVIPTSTSPFCPCLPPLLALRLPLPFSDGEPAPASRALLLFCGSTL